MVFLILFISGRRVLQLLLGFRLMNDLEIMERAERIDKICNMARSLYARGLDPNDYVDEIFESVGIDVDSLSSDEIDKINRACR